MSKQTQAARQLIVVPHNGVARQQVKFLVEKAGGVIVKATDDGEYNLVSAKDDDELQKVYEVLNKAGELRMVQFKLAT